MRITHLASGDLWAGAETQLHNMVLALHRAGGVDVDLVLLNEGILAQRVRAAGVPVTVFPEQQLGGWRLLTSIRRHLTSRKTQVLHTHRYKENVLGAAATLITRGARTMRTLHGAPEFAVSAVRLGKSAPQWLDWLVARVVQFPIVCVSEELRQRCARNLPAARLRVVPNGVDIADLQRRAVEMECVNLPGGAGPCRIGFFGRLSPVKRVDILIRTAAILERTAPGGYLFHVFGDGPLRAELEVLARECGVSQAVQFMGFASEPAPCLRAMDAMLLTSDHEGLPMIVLEAMALRVPVISHAVGAIPEVLGGGTMGTLIQGQRPEDYARAIQHLRAAPEDLAAKTERAFEQVTRRYSAEETVREYIDIYRELSGQPG